MDVGIRELKARLSEYVERAAKGEVIRVTDRGEPKAVLGPLRDDDVIERGIAEGWLTRRSLEPPRPFTPLTPAPGTPTTEEILAEDRGD
jgi:prevent-host-death family protein